MIDLELEGVERQTRLDDLAVTMRRMDAVTRDEFHAYQNHVTDKMEQVDKNFDALDKSRQNSRTRMTTIRDKVSLVAFLYLAGS